MTVPTALPGPRSNRTKTGNIDRADGLAGTDLVVAVGDYTGGAAEDLFTATAHGLITGDYVWLLYKDAAGAVTGRVGTRFRVKYLTANTFNLTDTAGNVIANTADGAVVVLLKGTHAVSDAVVQTVILPALIVATGDYTGGTTEDMFTPAAATGYHGLEEADPLLLLYKSASGVVAGKAAGATVYAKSVTTAAFELSATAGGDDIEHSADGTAVFLKLV